MTLEVSIASMPQLNGHLRAKIRLSNVVANDIRLKSKKWRRDQMQVLILLIFVWILFLTPNTGYAKRPPPDVMRSLESLSLVSAAINICFDSVDAKKLSSQRYLVLSDIISDTEDIAEWISKKYSEKSIPLAFQAAVAGHMASTEYQTKLRRRYNNLCSVELQDESRQTLRKIWIDVNKSN